MKKLFIILLLIVISNHLFAEENVIINAYNRTSFSLNGKWHYIVDPYENGFYDYRYKPFDDYDNPEQSGGYFVNQKPQNKSDRVEYDFDKSDQLNVPGDWNSQTEKLYYYEGTIWYKKSFDYRKKKADNRVFLYFGAANYQADVYLNARKLGVHKGGFTPFNFEIPDILKEKDNFVIVKVDNKRHAAEVPTLNTDWWNFGGLTRDVKIIEVPATFISDYFLQLKKGSLEQLTGYVQLDGSSLAGQEIKLSIPGLKIREKLVTDDNGRAAIDFAAKNINHWSPENPHLYEITFKSSDDQVSDDIGFRSIITRGQDILLNGKPIFLRGICIHEENPMRGGRAYSIEDARTLLTWAQELGCNFVRLAHYPHNEHTIRLADKMGIMVWEENPVYWTIQWENEATFQTAKKQLSEVIARDKNRAAVIIWSMANETPVSDARMSFLTRLRDFALSVDNTRLISAALEMHAEGEGGLIRKIEDPFAEYVDVLSFNEYIGWYDGLPDKCGKIQWQIEQDKPVVISEFGGGALQGLHGDKLTRWTDLYNESIAMLTRIPQLRGTCPWILADFHSPRRPLPDIQDDWNRKGLIGETGARKKAFYVMREFYEGKKEE